MLSLVPVIIAGAIAAGFVQGLSGFGFGLVAMSLWAWTLEPQLAAVLTVFGSVVGQLMAIHTGRRGFDARLLAPFLLGGLAGIPLGVLLLPHMDMATFRAVLGALLAIWCPAMLFSHHLPRVRAGGRFGDGLAGLAGGILGGLGGFTGVIPVLWCTLRQYPKETQRAIIQNFNLSMLSVTLAIYAGTGLITADMLPLCALVIPAMLLPTLLGTRLYARLSDARFRQIILALLTLSGITLLASAASSLLH